MLTLSMCPAQLHGSTLMVTNKSAGQPREARGQILAKIETGLHSLM